MHVRQAVEITRLPERMIEPGTDAVFHGERHPHRLRNDEDVAEDDRRIHTENVDRLQGNLDRQLGCPHHREKIGALPDGAILGEIAPGLAHHPDGWTLDPLAPAGAQEKIVHGRHTRE